MFKVKTIIVILLCIALSLPIIALADEATALQKKIMFDQKKLIVMQNMEFTEDESKFFWPVYNDFQKELFKFNQRAARLIVAYASVYQTMTDEQAAKIVKEYFDIQKGRTSILDSYMQELSKGLPAKKVFRYLQVENKLEAMARYELSKGIPLAQ